MRTVNAILLLYVFILLSTYVLTTQVAAQLNQTASYSQQISDIERPSPPSSTQEWIIQPRPTTELYLSLGVLAFGLLLVLFTVIVALKGKTGWNQEATRIFTVSVITMAGLFLITAGYSDQQVAPMFALLGSIIGYIFGKTSSKEPNDKKD